MTQNDFEFIRDSFLGKCDSLLMEIAKADALMKQTQTKAIEEAKQKEKEEKENEKKENK